MRILPLVPSCAGFCKVACKRHNLVSVLDPLNGKCWLCKLPQTTSIYQRQVALLHNLHLKETRLVSAADVLVSKQILSGLLCVCILE